jgi:hypothetical protein
MGTVDAHLLAIDAKSGQLLWDSVVADAAAQYSITMPPLVVKDKVIIGTAGGDMGIRGFVAAYDARSGSQVWKFHTIPGPGEPGHDTWSGDSWQKGGAAVWNHGAFDAAANLVYFGTGNPAPDWDGRTRLGDNLYSDSVIALDADTGRLKWHYQFTPHDELDYDSTQVPLLADIAWHGTPRKVMLWANRNGLMYVLDRITGEFLLGRPYVEVNWMDGFDANGRPLRVPGIVPTPQGTLVRPHVHGAINWAPPAYTDEATSATGIPGDNQDRRWQDCFFDGNSGGGDDGCRFHTCCLLGAACPADLAGGFDPLTDCELSAECIEFCLPGTTPGCDCFGCCEIWVDGVSYTVYTNPAIAPECTLDRIADPAYCPPCTPPTDCLNPCVPEDCELCPGMTVADLPPECSETPPACDPGVTPCDTTADCPTGYYCSLGCCIEDVVLI